MEEQELARKVARDLGAEVLEAVENPDATRTKDFSEVWAIASFVVAAAQLVVQIWQARRDHALLVQALAGLGDDTRMGSILGDAADAGKVERLKTVLTPEQRLGYVARTLERFLPDMFGAPRTARSAVEVKRAWVTAYFGSRGDGNPTERDFTGAGPLLLPFADMDYFIVCRAIGWLPGPGDEHGLPRVDVPRGFVTDLATIPSYLWPIWQRTGRYGNAAIYHDWLYWEQTTSRATADAVFMAAMNDMGVDLLTQHLMWAGVRVFGGGYWDDCGRERRHGGKRVLKEFPADPRITWRDWQQQSGVFE